ncbi:hypothetical protein KSP40_PGU008484 [Platanthera guangdongensis]|uniref:Uncharacterized protein n=1 Tax=Platanthera guangdongensis TaxID=2320717 RepID=A0ABR2LH13_9ASPA
MLRTAVSSSALRRITAAASSPAAINKFLSPSIAPAILAAPCSSYLAACSGKAFPLFFLSFPGQTRGYARGHPIPSKDNDLSDGDGGDDSEDFLPDSDGEDRDEMEFDEESLDVDDAGMNPIDWIIYFLAGSQFYLYSSA